MGPWKARIAACSAQLYASFEPAEADVAWWMCLIYSKPNESLGITSITIPQVGITGSVSNHG